MVEKRGAGKRADVYLDSIDYEIIEILRDNSEYNPYGAIYKGLGVLDLVNKLNIHHTSLKPHIDKLMYLGLISVWKNSEGKIVISLSSIMNSEWLQYGDPTKEDIETMSKQIEKHNYLFNTLKKLKQYNHIKKIGDNITDELEFDLRKKTEIKKIDYQKELKIMKENERKIKENKKKVKKKAKKKAKK